MLRTLIRSRLIERMKFENPNKINVSEKIKYKVVTALSQLLYSSSHLIFRPNLLYKAFTFGTNSLLVRLP